MTTGTRPLAGSRLTLSDLAVGHDNNFNLIRLLAAWAVLASHCFPLGRNVEDPLWPSLGTTIGTLAVDVFFVTSGFLVTAGLMSRKSVIDFIWARVLRIYPGLWVMLILVVGVLGPLMTTESLAGYFSSATTRAYLLKNGYMFNGASHLLPGVFENVPFKGAVNGSLWTLMRELRAYAALVVLWVATGWLPASQRLLWFRRLLLAAALVCAVINVTSYVQAGRQHSLTWTWYFMFFTGASFCAFKDRIVLSWTAFAVALAAMLLATRQEALFFAVYSICVAYVLFFIAYVPAGPLRLYNRLGDYSYGIYIYAFPVQQTLMALWPGLSILQLGLLATPIVAVLAVASSLLVEQPALKLRSRSVMRTRQWLRLKAHGEARAG